MRKNELQEIENLIKEDQNIDDKREALVRHTFSNALIKAIIIFVVILFGIIFNEKVSLLSVISPNIFYFITGIVLMLLIVFMVLIKIYKNDKTLETKTFYKIYKKYDISMFVSMTIIMISFITLFIVTPTTVEGNSMNSTLSNGDKILVWHLGYTPKRDDIVVININEHYYATEALYIKRIVAISGDTVEYIDGYLVVNGSKIEQIYQIEYDNICQTVKDKTDDVAIKNNIVPKGFSIVLGDNRGPGQSNDSRNLGLIYNEDILGVAFFRVFPFKKIKIF